MKKLLLAFAVVAVAVPAYATSTLYSNSSSVGIGTTSPTTGTALDIGSNTNSMLLPVGTTAQRPTGVAGMLRYNSSNSVPEFYTGSWLPLPLTASSPIVINSTTGNITCPTCNTSSANVISVSGDGALISNSASTGALTLTLGNAAGYSVWGNNTSSSAIPAYTTSPKLSGTISDIQTVGVISTDGLIVVNPTAAALGSQQWSPRIRWAGQGWKTNATAASQEVDAIAEIQPIQGATNPGFSWVLSGQINSSGYTPLLTLSSGGGLNLNSGTYQINGVQIAASNLSNGTTGSGSIVLATSPTLTTPNIGAATGTSLSVSGTMTANVFSGSGASLTNVPATALSGNLPVTNLNNGTGASSSTYWRGDGTWANPSASGALILLNTVTASSSTSVSFNSTYLTGYNKYIIKYNGVFSPASGSAGSIIGMQFSTNNGVSWVQTGYAAHYGMGTGTISTSIRIAGDSTLSTGPSTPSPEAPAGIQGTIEISSNTNNIVNVFFESDGWMDGTSGNNSTGVMYQGTGTYKSTNDSPVPLIFNAIRFIDDSGNNVSFNGVFSLYGLQQ